MDETNERAQQAPATDVERTQILARLITERLELLDLWRARGGFTPELAREFFVLRELRDGWLLEGKPAPPA